MKLFVNGLKKRFYECIIVIINHLPISLYIWKRANYNTYCIRLTKWQEVSHKIRWIVHVPNNNVPAFSSYKVHGVPFRTKSRDDAHQVQCNGVCADAETMIMQATDKNIEHMSHTYYRVIDTILSWIIIALGSHFFYVNGLIRIEGSRLMN